MTASGRWPFTHRQLGNDGDGKTTQLDRIIEPERTSDKAFIHNDVNSSELFFFQERRRSGRGGDLWMMKPKNESTKTAMNNKEKIKNKT